MSECEQVLNRAEVMQKLMFNVVFDSHGNEKNRKILQTVKNHEIVFNHDLRFAGKVKFDEFAQQVVLSGSVPWEPKNICRAWGSFDDSSAFSIIQSDYGLCKRQDFFDAVRNVSMKNRFHPVRDMLDALIWDNRENIRGLLVDYLGSEDSEYNYQAMRLCMVGTVARVYEPGIKNDNTPILVGPQGVGKSTFLRSMAMRDSWFCDSLDSLDNDKAVQTLLGSWIIELAELKSLTRTAGGTDSIKRFLSAQQDKIRLPYERRSETFLRQCTFWGTTNKSDFLDDETGNRRFLIIQTGVNKPRKDLFAPEAMEDIKAAWAQAVHIWKTERPALVLPEEFRQEAEQMQEASTTDDGTFGLIQEYLEDKQRVCALEIWQETLGEIGRPPKWKATQINNFISQIPGWRKMKSPGRFGKFGQQRGFEFVSNSGDDSNDFVAISGKSGLNDLPFK